MDWTGSALFAARPLKPQEEDWLMELLTKQPNQESSLAELTGLVVRVIYPSPASSKPFVPKLLAQTENTRQINWRVFRFRAIWRRLRLR